jgi:hypothetical protein
LGVGNYTVEHMARQLHLTVTAILSVAVSGCVGFVHTSAPKSWPKPVPATNVLAFDGVFSNRSVDIETGAPSDKGRQLFDFLTGCGHQHGKQGVYVAIDSSPVDDSIYVRLLDEHKLEIDSAVLAIDVAYVVRKGFLMLYGPFSGTHAKSTNMGYGIDRKSSQLYLTEAGALLGRQGEVETGLLFCVVPVFTSSKDSMLWRRISLE